MSEPPVWKLEELETDVELARNSFRDERQQENRELYNKTIEQFEEIFVELLSNLRKIISDKKAKHVPDIFADEDKRTAFRYLTAPPISEDDLKTIADTSIAPGVLREDPAKAIRVRDTIVAGLDHYRIPWIADDRRPRPKELSTAARASAMLVATRKVETARRSDATKLQTELVTTQLLALGFKEVATRDISTLADAPDPGEFCGESLLGDTRADIVIRLRDNRLLAIECKVSNSSVNSYKRVNHEALNKAKHWLDAFGKRNVVPAVVLSGVYSAPALETAQASLAIFWAHRIDDLADFIKSAR